MFVLTVWRLQFYRLWILLLWNDSGIVQMAGAREQGHRVRMCSQ